MTRNEQALPVEAQPWRINPETPSVIITPHGRISIPWMKQAQGSAPDYSLAEQTAAMVVDAVNAANAHTRPSVSDGAGEVMQALADLDAFAGYEDGYRIETAADRELLRRCASAERFFRVHGPVVIARMCAPALSQPASGGVAREKVLREALLQIEFRSTNHGAWFEQDPFGEYSKLGDIARAALAAPGQDEG